MAPTATSLAGPLAPHITNKTILITGPSPTSLGHALALALAPHAPRLLILAGRSPPKLAESAALLRAANPALQVRLLDLDLGSQASVRAAAAAVNEWADVPALDVVVCNAGIMAVEYGVTAEGVERQLGTNYLGHWLFVNLVVGKVLAGGEGKGGRVVSVASDGHRLGGVRGDWGFDDGKTYNRWVAYGQSKTGNMLMALSLAEKLGGRGLRAYSLHPGVVWTGLVGHVEDTEGLFAELHAVDKSLGNLEGWDTELKLMSPDEGAATAMFAAFSPELEDHNGAYLQDCQVADPWVHTVKAWATSPVEAEKLWKLSEKLVGQEFKYEA
ncbi:hypothetical protein QBC39DRAFT_409048 [Podospora conica]|nr:hypothetical protein QBC39DRAFT_409048 [Schizothecium conicum]